MSAPFASLSESLKQLVDRQQELRMADSRLRARLAVVESSLEALLLKECGQELVDLLRSCAVYHPLKGRQ